MCSKKAKKEIKLLHEKDNAFILTGYMLYCKKPHFSKMERSEQGDLCKYLQYSTHTGTDATVKNLNPKE